MPPTKRAPARNHVMGPYDRPGQNQTESRKSSEDSPEVSRPSGGILSTPGRFLSGVISWLSPWRSKQPENDEESESDSADGSENGGGTSQHSEDDNRTENTVNRNLPRALNDPNLASFAAKLDAKFPPSSFPAGSQNFRDYHRADEGSQDPSKAHGDGVMNSSGMGDLATSLFGGEGVLHRPRAIPKTNILAVARLVSRMGAANRERKRRLAGSFALKAARFTVLPEPPAPDSAVPSAFRVVVSRPLPLPQAVRPLEVTRTGTWFASRGQDLTPGSDRRGRVNESALSAQSMMQDISNTANASGVGNSLDHMNSSVMSRRSNSVNESLSSLIGSKERVLSAKEFSEKALSTLNNALAPFPLRADIGSVPRSRDQFTPVDGHISAEATCPTSNRVGDKRQRESFAPEPSSSTKIDFTLEMESRERPLQRPRTVTAGSSAHPPPYTRVNPKSTQTVRRILDIIKETSASSARAPPEPPSFRSTADKRRMSNDSGFEFGGRTKGTVLGFGSAAFDSDQQSSKCFTFSAPDPIGFADRAAASAASTLAPSGRRTPTFTFRDPDDDEEVEEPRTGDLAGTTASVQPPVVDMAAKTREREEQKRQLALKAGVPTKFQWPKQKGDVTLEPSGNKELDEEDGFMRRGTSPSTAASSKETPSTKSNGVVNASSSSLPSLADMFKPKAGEWRCENCMSLNKPDAKIKCLSCEVPRPGVASAGGGTSSSSAPTFRFGVDPPAAPASQSFKFGPSSTEPSTTGLKFGAESSSSSGGLKFGVSPALASASTAPLTFKFGGTSSATESGKASVAFLSTGAVFSFDSGSSKTGASSSAASFKFGGDTSSVGTGFKLESSSQANGLPTPTTTAGFSMMPASSSTAPSFSFGTTAATDKTAVGGPSDGSGARKLSADEERKAKEREEQKKVLAAKAGVPMKFQWPEKKQDVGLEASGNKELDEEDGMAGKAVVTEPVKSVTAPFSAPSFTFTSAPAFPSGGANSSGTSSSCGAASKSTFSFGSASSAVPVSGFVAAPIALTGASASTSGVSVLSSTNPSTTAASAFTFSATSNPSFSFNGSQSIAPAATIAAGTMSSAPAFAFGNAAPATSMPTFAFGGSSASSLSADSVSKPVAATAALGQSAPSFGGFGSSAPPASASVSTSTPSSTPFAFGAASSAGSASAPFSFGAAAGGFQFGTATSSAPPVPSAAAPVFSFGAPASSAAASAASIVAAPSTGGLFAFGAVQGNSAAPIGGAFGAPGGGFAFGAQNSHGAVSTGAGEGMMADDDGAAAPKPFAFGAPSTAAAAAPYTFGAPPAAPTFSFGAAAGAGAGSGFSFSAPSSAAAASGFGAASSSAPSFGGFGSGGFGATPSSAPLFGVGAGGFGASSGASFSFSAPASAPSFGAGSGFGAPTSAPAFGFSGASTPSFAGFGGASAPSFGAGAFGASSAPVFGASGFGGASAPSFGAAAGGFGTAQSGGGFGFAAPGGTGFGFGGPAAPAGFGAAGAGGGALPTAFGAGGGFGFGAGGTPATPGTPGGEVPQRKMVKAKRSTGQGRGRGH